MNPPESPRLDYRPYAQDDLADLTRLYTDPEIARHTYLGVRTPAQCQGILDDYLATWTRNGWGMHALTLKETGAYVGEAGIFELWGRDAPHVRYLLLKEFWGRGLASEAARAVTDWCFAGLGLSHLYGVTEENNPQSSTVLVKTGYRVDEHTRNHEKNVAITIYRIDNETAEAG